MQAPVDELAKQGEPPADPQLAQQVQKQVEEMAKTRQLLDRLQPLGLEQYGTVEQVLMGQRQLSDEQRQTVQDLLKSVRIGVSWEARETEKRREMETAALAVQLNKVAVDPRPLLRLARYLGSLQRKSNQAVRSFWQEQNRD